MVEYEPGSFKDLYDEFGKKIWVFLWEPDNIIRLETASELIRPALEALATRLVEKFGDDIRPDRIKQMTGHMTRQVMEARGFHLDAQNIKVRIGDLFKYASRYRRNS